MESKVGDEAARQLQDVLHVYDDQLSLEQSASNKALPRTELFKIDLNEASGLLTDVMGMKLVGLLEDNKFKFMMNLQFGPIETNPQETPIEVLDLGRAFDLVLSAVP